MGIWDGIAQDFKTINKQNTYCIKTWTRSNKEITYVVMEIGIKKIDISTFSFVSIYVIQTCWRYYLLV